MHNQKSGRGRDAQPICHGTIVEYYAIFPSSNFSSPTDCRWLIVQSLNIGSKSLRNFPHLLFVSAIFVKLKMKLQKKISVANKAVRKSKPVLIPTIKWTMTDNLCLLYAIWEMCTPLQKLILTVIQLSTCI